MPEAVLRRAFPLADPAGPVTRHYLDAWASRGLYPALAWRETIGGWTYWSFPPFLIRSDAAGRVEAAPGAAGETPLGPVPAGSTAPDANGAPRGAGRGPRP